MIFLDIIIISPTFPHITSSFLPNDGLMWEKVGGDDDDSIWIIKTSKLF